MSEEIIETSELSNEAMAENVSHETNSEPAQQNQQKEDKPPGYYPVQLDDLPPEKAKAIEDRFSYFYRQVKQQEKSLSDFRTIAQQQSERLNELTNGVVRVVDHLQTKATAETESDIRQKMQSAWETGDNKTYLEQQEKLIEIKARAFQPKPQNQTQQQAYAGVKSASQLANDAVKSGEISPHENTIVNAWQDETDERGQPLRPWAKTDDPNDPDPDYMKAFVTAKKVFEQNPHKSIQENLQEVDRRMGVRKTTSGQQVMGGSLTTPSKNRTIKLSPEIEKLAVRMKFAGPKASDAENIAAYKKQIDETRSSQGRR